MTLEQIIRLMWARRRPDGDVTAALRGMCTDGAMPVPRGLTPEQDRFFKQTHLYMVRSVQEFQAIVEPLGLDPEVWRWLRRGGVCYRILSTSVDDTEHIRLLNAMRGERRPHGKPVIRLWEQLAYSGGHGDAVLAFLRHAIAQHPDDYFALGLDAYKTALDLVLPQLRRCTKPNQERRSAR